MNYGGYFDPDSKEKQIKELESKTLLPNFWDSKKDSEKVISQLNELKNKLEKTSKLKEKTESNVEILESIKNEMDLEIKELLESEIDSLTQQLETLEIETLLSKPYDSCNAILEIHSGAGGTESNDWANMLFRMYTRFFDKNDYKYEVISKNEGEEIEVEYRKPKEMGIHTIRKSFDRDISETVSKVVDGSLRSGIKSLTAIVKGINAYGYLKNEKGIHRLVRISPFDSNSRRHTSFAGVDVTPLFENEKIDIEIKQSDIRIDVYRSSGCGGQGVNTTDSAVRITHIPTKIVVTCQNERSQIQNKEKAMEVLLSKLYKLEIEKRNDELKNIKGNLDDINFGSQIRSYIMCPYTLVKDHRTNTEVTNVEDVLDGNIDVFINSALKEG